MRRIFHRNGFVSTLIELAELELGVCVCVGGCKDFDFSDAFLEMISRKFCRSQVLHLRNTCVSHQGEFYVSIKLSPS